jgi:putative membrane protein insertion efficiency factor
MAGWPVRSALLLVIRVYRLTLGYVIGGNCRFYPSCSAYSELAIARCGAVRGTALAVWRVLRCSPLSAGGVDRPPGGSDVYESIIQRRRPSRRRGVPA